MRENTRERPLVLVVDDDEDMRVLAGAQLRDGYDVLAAEDGVHCVELAREQRPDVILLDMMMPGMSGADVLRALGEADSTKDIPVIFLSALTAIEDRVRGLEEGAVDWISKPIESRELVARVGVAARIRARQEELRSRLALDGATGLGDRFAFNQRLAHEVARSSRSNAPLSVLLIDIDGMTGMNDRWGELIGDELIQVVAEELRAVLRTSDGIYRYEGDDFAAVLPDTDMSTAFLAAERCRHAIMEMPTGRGDITISLGVAEYASGRKPEDLVAKAQIALFRAKESGGNRSWRADDPRRHSLHPIALSEDLTEREWAILGHLANRRTEAEIAGRLEIRPGTVRSHKARIRRKLHVDTDVRLSDFAQSNFRQLVERLDRIESSGKETVS
ncbi:MAG TPA: diguanylate cyclase [Actinomycetota bacterium]|nr:diguanylate cyclase [Actinomycetota bacterium]